jgi:hypothetical protein
MDKDSFQAVRARYKAVFEACQALAAKDPNHPALKSALEKLEAARQELLSALAPSQASD